MFISVFRVFSDLQGETLTDGAKENCCTTENREDHTGDILGVSSTTQATVLEERLGTDTSLSTDNIQSQTCESSKGLTKPVTEQTVDTSVNDSVLDHVQTVEGEHSSDPCSADVLESDSTKVRSDVLPEATSSPSVIDLTDSDKPQGDNEMEVDCTAETKLEQLKIEFSQSVEESVQKSKSSLSEDKELKSGK